VRECRIGDGVEGEVRLIGRVAAQAEQLEAPLSRDACVLYEVALDGNRYREARRAVRAVTFTIDDGTGKADVVFDRADNEPMLVTGLRHITAVVPHDVYVKGRWPFGGSRADAQIEAVSIELGVEPNSVGGPLSAHEGIIRVGDSVWVVGRASRESAPGGESLGYRSPTSKYVVRAAAEAPLTIIKRSASNG
jgi:hypothetical protein